jgi:hypothetical protein
LQQPQQVIVLFGRRQPHQRIQRRTSAQICLCSGHRSTGFGGLKAKIAQRRNGIGGYWGSQILPFQDVSSYPGFIDFETTVYRHLQR